MKDPLAELASRLEKGETVALATIVGTAGSTPQKPGARLLVAGDGTTTGTLGGGCVEAEAWAEATEALKRGKAVLRTFELREEWSEEGLVCGGTMDILLEPWGPQDLPLAREIARAREGAEPAALLTGLGEKALGQRCLLKRDGSTLGKLENIPEVSWEREEPYRAGDYFVEVFSPLPSLVVMGAGHIAHALCPLAAQVGLRVLVLDDRPDFATPQRFPEASQVVAAPFVQLAQLPVGAHSAIVVATRGHQQDDTALEAALNTPAWYVGMVGSRRKAQLIQRALEGRGVSRAKLARVRSPVGLDIGARTPQEIAVSILAEIIMLRRGGEGRPMTTPHPPGPVCIQP